MPVENPTSIGEYSESMVFNSTLGRFSAHMAIDFFADEGTDVLAVYDGKISKIENTLLKGTTITIEHGNGLYTVYNSLADGDSVSVGQKVKQGDVIGQVSLTNRQEYKSGAHLHFEVIENGENIDPSKYLAFEEK
jgi:murein DD-endopeptidase MepM/ murein hydrolase activator NlpD